LPGPATGPFHWDNRPLSVAEMLRLQTFPLDWKVIGTRREQVRQVGNATPPLIAEMIGVQVNHCLFGDRKPERLSLAIKQSKRIPAASRPSAVPRRFRALVGNYSAHPGAGKGPGALRAAESRHG
jgi:DNA (cytosine-5)-methyltransferase 1